MSHVAKIDLVVKDLTALEAACKELGLELVRGQKTYKWYGRWVQDYHEQDAAYKHGIDPATYGKNAEHAIRVRGDSHAYEIGLVKNGDHFDLIYDFYGGGMGLEGHTGPKLQKLKQYYAKHVTLKKAKSMGYRVREDKKEDGQIRLTLTR